MVKDLRLDQSAIRAFCEGRGKAAGLLRRLLHAVATHRTARDEPTTYAVTKATRRLPAGICAALSRCWNMHSGVRRPMALYVSQLV